MQGRTIICGAIWWLCVAPLWASAWAGSWEAHDSLVVDGVRFDYISDVNIDSLFLDNSVLEDDWEWWLGAGWEVHASAAQPTLDWLSSSLSSHRPNVFLERRVHHGRTGQTWALRVDHHQPWALNEGQVSPFVKGWIAGDDAVGSSPLRQVVLIPDSLAFERDTLQAPLTPGHALRLGLVWEGADAASAWRPRLAVAVDVLRPRVWRLQFPQDPSQWSGLSQEDVLQELGRWAHRVRIEAGVVSDWRRPDMVKRSAGQLRASLFVVPGQMWGIRAVLATSPTRR